MIIADKLANGRLHNVLDCTCARAPGTCACGGGHFSVTPGAARVILNAFPQGVGPFEFSQTSTLDGFPLGDAVDTATDTERKRALACAASVDAALLQALALRMSASWATAGAAKQAWANGIIDAAGASIAAALE